MGERDGGEVLEVAAGGEVVDQPVDRLQVEPGGDLPDDLVEPRLDLLLVGLGAELARRLGAESRVLGAAAVLFLHQVEIGAKAEGGTGILVLRFRRLRSRLRLAGREVGGGTAAVRQDDGQGGLGVVLAVPVFGLSLPGDWARIYRV